MALKASLATYNYTILKPNGGKTILEYLSSFDLASNKIEYYRHQDVLVNGEKVKLDYILKENMEIKYRYCYNNACKL